MHIPDGFLSRRGRGRVRRSRRSGRWATALRPGGGGPRRPPRPAARRDRGVRVRGPDAQLPGGGRARAGTSSAPRWPRCCWGRGSPAWSWRWCWPCRRSCSRTAASRRSGANVLQHGRRSAGSSSAGSMLAARKAAARPRAAALLERGRRRRVAGGDGGRGRVRGRARGVGHGAAGRRSCRRCSASTPMIADRRGGDHRRRGQRGARLRGPDLIHGPVPEPVRPDPGDPGDMMTLVHDPRARSSPSGSPPLASPDASSSPDGLEKVAAESGVPRAAAELHAVQEESPVPDYAVPGRRRPARRRPASPASAARCVVFGLGYGLAAATRRPAGERRERRRPAPHGRGR